MSLRRAPKALHRVRRLPVERVRRLPVEPPGRPPLSVKQQLYIRLMAQGMNNVSACRVVGISSKTGTRWKLGRTMVRNGRVHTYRPITELPARRAAQPVSARFLSEQERLTIADGLHDGQSLRSIAAELGRSPSTISREVANNADPVSGRYRPHSAQRKAEDRRSRPKPGKLVLNLELAAFVQSGLEKRWSPEQVSNALAAGFPDRLDMRVCHETIYQALYHPARGGLRRELARSLRTRRLRRKCRRRPDGRRSRFGGAMTMIAERPTEIAGRAVAGHWEGDLIVGKANGSAIGTLVERTTRYLKLLHLPAGHGAESTRDTLIEKMSALPCSLARSITWDQGSEMARHDEVTATTGIPVYFCDPASPWQRGSNENTNGLLRQYFPKGTDLSGHGADELEAVAAELNARPRKTLGWDTPAACLERLIVSAT